MNGFGLVTRVSAIFISELSKYCEDSAQTAEFFSLKVSSDLELDEFQLL